MFSLLSDLNAILTPRDRFLAFCVFLVVLAFAATEIVGIGSIVWFVSVLGEPNAIENSRVLKTLHELLGRPDYSEFVISVGVLLLVVMVARNLMQLLTIWAQQRFVLFRNHVLCRRLMRAYLGMPYAFFLQRHTAELSKNILNEVARVASGILYPMVEALTSIALILTIFGFLLVENPAMTLIAGAVVGIATLACYLPLHSRLSTLGLERQEADALRFKTASDSLSGIKDARILGRTDFFLDRFSNASDRFFRRELVHKILSQIPHFALETIAFVGILGMVFYTNAEGRPGSETLATLSLFTIASYRLLPQVKNVLRDLTILRYSESSLELLGMDLSTGKQGEDEKSRRAEPLPFSRALELDGVSFRYEGAARDTLSDISMTVPCHQSIALVGPTGAGKTTIVDIVLGLLVPSEGEIRVDGKTLAEGDLPSWQANVGYVPQTIFLTDDSLRRNIAFGLPDHEIDDKAVRTAAKLARIDDFIDGLPDGYDTEIGERGTRLSGGQRQRIGIARALYHRPPLLVLDEGTSALDGATEKEVTSAIAALAPEVTMIIIAHRLATVRACDRVYLVKDGRIVDSGAFDRLVRDNADFRAMAQLA